MLELILLAQMVRDPLRAMARRLYCRSLQRASRGQLTCSGCAGD